MKTTLSFLVSLLCFLSFSNAQELFIRQEPASNIPLHVLSVRGSFEEYNEGTQIRTEDIIRFMYGVSSRLELFVSPIVSNHHLDSLPPELISTDNGTLRLHSHNKKLGYPRPYLFAGFDFYGKYLLLKDDGTNEHFRVSAFGEASSCLQAHDEAETDLMGDNAGVGAGLVATVLYHHFAASVTGEYIYALPYNEPKYGAVFTYPQAFHYIGSLGYLIFPVHYKSYKQLNINLYAEFEGEDYGSAKVVVNGTVSDLTGAYTLLSNAYLDFHPGIQLILFSNTRIDFSMGFSVISQSYRYTYPTHLVQLQHYFFF